MNSLVGIKDFLEINYIASGDVFWKKRDGKMLKILRAGSIVDRDFLCKFENVELQIDSYLDDEECDRFENLFKALQTGISDLERAKAAKKIIEHFYDVYVMNDGFSILNAMISMRKIFYRFDEKSSDQLNAKNSETYVRSVYMGMMIVILAMELGHFDFDFLTDLYNTAYLIDVAFMDGAGYNTMEAMELERKENGAGIERLENEGELSDFLNNSRMSVEKASVHFSYYFHNPELLNAIIFSHEKADGNGFPEHVSEENMSDVEALISAVNHIFPYEMSTPQKNNSDLTLKKLLLDVCKDGNHVISMRLKKIISSRLNG